MHDYSGLSRAELIERLEKVERQLSSAATTGNSRATSEEKYHALFENMVEEVHFWKVERDADGTINNWRLIDLNPAAERSWNVKRADVVGRTADDIFSTALDHFMPIVRKIFDEQKPYSWETFFPDLQQHMKMTSVAFGEYFFTTGFDITELKNIQARQEKLGVMARMATEASGIGVWELDLQSGHLTWNEQMLEIFGTDPEDLTHTAQDWSARLHPEDRDALVAKLQHCIDTGNSFQGSFRIVTPSGETKIVDARSEVLRHEATDSPILIGTNIDVTEQQKLIREMQEAQALAEQSSKAKSEFLASMSHELRTPMNAVLGYTQMLQLFADSRLNETDKEYLQHILESGQLLLALINDVLDLSQIEAGGVTIEEEELDIRDLFTRATQIIRPIAQKKQVTVEQVSMPLCAPHIRTDRIRINQILLNLLSNAVRHSPEGGHVALSATIVAPNRVRLAVADQGEGISARDQDTIFDPFVRLNKDPLISSDGFGIGLAVSRKLAEQMGGSIGLNSDIGSGSSFWVEFPCQKCSERCLDFAVADASRT